MERKEYIKKLEDGSKLRFTVNISSTIWNNYKVDIQVMVHKCLPKKRTWLGVTDVPEEDIKHYKRLYLTEIINGL